MAELDWMLIYKGHLLRTIVIGNQASIHGIELDEVLCCE